MCGGGKPDKIDPTADQITQQQNNVKLWNYYVKNYKPIIEKYSARVTDTGRQEAQRRDVAGRINAEVMKNVTPAVASDNPIKTAKTLTDLSEVATGAKMQGEGGVKARQVADVQNVIDIGRGEETVAQAGLEDIASQSVRSEIASKQTQMLEQAAISDAYGSMAGAISAGLLRQRPPTTKRRVINTDLINQNVG